METIWNPRYDTGIQVIDAQHRELFQLVNRLREGVRNGADRTEIEGLLDDLVASSARHFATEESHMARVEYPDLAHHKTEHASMLTSLHELREKFRESHQAMALMVPTFMEGWLRHHISDGDFGFVTFLKARNLA